MSSFVGADHGSDRNEMNVSIDLANASDESGP